MVCIVNVHIAGESGLKATEQPMKGDHAMSKCIVLTLDYDEYRPPNCPNCGRFMGWNKETNKHICSCNGFLYHHTTGDSEVDKEFIEEGTEYEDLPFAICKKPEGWKDEWGLWLIPEKVQILEESNNGS